MTTSMQAEEQIVPTNAPPSSMPGGQLLSGRRACRAALSGLMLALGVMATLVQAQAQYPSKPVRVIIPNAPGSPGDILSRLMGPRLTEQWGQPVIVENRTGATGLIGVEAAAKAAPDGHTVTMVTMTQLISTLMYQRYQLATEFTAISMVGTTPFAIVVPAAIPVKNIPEFIAYAKARPGQLMFSSSGQWGSSHLCLEDFNELAGLKMTHVPHPSSPAAMNAIISEQVFAYCPAGPGIQSAPAGKIRVLGITYQKPTRLLPGVPPISESLPFELLGWYGLLAPLKIPATAVTRLNTDVQRVLGLAEIQEKFVGMGVEANGSTPAEFSNFLRRESERWGKVLKDRNAKLD